MPQLWNALDRLATIGLIAVSALLIWRLVVADGIGAPAESAEKNATGQPPQPTSVNQMANRLVERALLDEAATLGRSDAAVAIVEFSDYQCPFCAEFARQSFGTIRREYVDTGRVKYIALNLPLQHIHPFALRAAESTECLREQGRFWQGREALFAGHAPLDSEVLERSVTTVGADVGLWRTCLKQEKYEARILAQLAAAQSLSVNATPTFLLGRFVQGGSFQVSGGSKGAIPPTSLGWRWTTS